MAGHTRRTSIASRLPGVGSDRLRRSGVRASRASSSSGEPSEAAADRLSSASAPVDAAVDVDGDTDTG